MPTCTGNPACSKECLAAGRHIHPFPDWMHPLEASREATATDSIRDLLLTFEPLRRVGILTAIEMCRGCGWIGEGARRCQCQNDE